MSIQKQAANKLYPGAHIRTFVVNGAMYEHRIFPAEDYRVECKDIDGNMILTYTSNCTVLDKHKRQIGLFTTNKESQWVFQYNGRTFQFGENLLNAEVGVSELYIRGVLE